MIHRHKWHLTNEYAISKEKENNISSLLEQNYCSSLCAISLSGSWKSEMAVKWQQMTASPKSYMLSESLQSTAR